MPAPTRTVRFVAKEDSKVRVHQDCSSRSSRVSRSPLAGLLRRGYPNGRHRPALPLPLPHHRSHPLRLSPLAVLHRHHVDPHCPATPGPARSRRNQDDSRPGGPVRSAWSGSYQARGRRALLQARHDDLRARGRHRDPGRGAGGADGLRGGAVCGAGEGCERCFSGGCFELRAGLHHGQ